HPVVVNATLALSAYLCQRPPSWTLFPYTTLFRSHDVDWCAIRQIRHIFFRENPGDYTFVTVTSTHLIPYTDFPLLNDIDADKLRSEEHTSELQSRFDLVCRLLLETKKTGYSSNVP